MRKSSILIIVFISIYFNVQAQSILGLRNSAYLDGIIKSIYASESLHSSIRPLFNPGNAVVDSLYKAYNLSNKIVPENSSLLFDKIFNAHAIEIQKPEFSLFLDPLINFSYGKDFEEPKSTYINTRGFQLGGSIGEKVHFYSNFYENQASFVDYINQNIGENGVIPGQGKIHTSLDNGYDFSKTSGYVLYSPSKYYNFQFGHGKNFFGDGFRSLILSDNSFNYPFLKITTHFWKIKYVNLFAQFQDLNGHNSNLGYDKKYTAMHYLSVKIGKRFNASIFEAIVFEQKDSTGHRGFDINYLNPVIFYRPVEFSVGSPDNALMGVNLSYVIGKSNVLYAQIILDEFKFDEVFGGNGWWANKQAYQLGFKSYGFAGLDNLFVQTEYNQAWPYTYSHWSSIQSWGHYNQPLAHPMGANFREIITKLRYHYKRYYLNYQFQSAVYGEDLEGQNYGKDVFQSYNTRPNDYDNFIGQGLKTNLTSHYLEMSYLVNPSYNLNIYLSYLNRQQKSDAGTHSTSYFSFGIRTSIENYYYDF